jgi:5-methylcytosine-specific restriction endonuclease McrBC regulatory subunit McrC
VGDEREMGLLFQDFVRTFLEREQRTFPSVSAPKVRWDLAGDDGGLLPSMNTDIVLRRPGQTVVIETKCYGEPFVTSRSGRATLRSKDVYQLASYVANLGASSPTPVEGVLLYAVDDERVPLLTSFQLGGRAFHIATLNLDTEWSKIEAALLQLVAACQHRA